MSGIVSPRLTQLVLKPTIHCFHRCSYCAPRRQYYDSVVQHECLPAHTALRVIDEAAAMGMRSLQLSGGDPLLYPQLCDLIRAGARHPGVFVFMNSVGGTVSLNRAHEIIDAGLGAWNFSVDTLDPETYADLRGVRGALPKVMTAVRRVREAANGRPGFFINYMAVITRRNFRAIPALVEHCVDTGIASIYFMYVYGDAERAHLLNEQDIAVFRDTVAPGVLGVLKAKAVPDRVQENAREVMSTFFSPDNDDADYARGIYWPGIDVARRACRAPYYYALVEPDGRVLPCCQLEISHDREAGNVTSRSLAEIWNGRVYADFRQQRIAFCVRCPAPRHKTLGLIPEMCRQFDE